MVRRSRMGDTPKVQINLTDSEIERVIKALESIAINLEKIANPLRQINAETGIVDNVRNLDITDPDYPIGPPWVLDE
jgi:hypothetical protein